MNTPSRNTTDHYRAVFLSVGMPYGRCFGSKHAYARRNPGRYFVSNASIFTSEGTCIWRGDIDLASKTERTALADASRRLRRALYVLLETADLDAMPAPIAWLKENALVVAWRGRVLTTGYTRRLYGSLPEVITRSRRIAKRGRRTTP